MLNDNISNIIKLYTKALIAIMIYALKIGLKFSIPIKHISREVVFSNFKSLSAQLNYHKPISIKAHNSLDAKL